MAKLHLILSLFFISSLVISPFATATGVEKSVDGNDPSWTVSTCKGPAAECLGNEEFSLDSESNRRILANSQYISYGALKRNTVPCSQKGASYYNCKAGAQANPYTRSCSAITRCRS